MKLVLKIFLVAITALTLLFALHQPALVAADSKSQIQTGVNDAAGGASSTAPGDTLNNVVRQVVDLFSIFTGVIAVIMIVFAGFRYVTSAGNAEATKTARSTITYAIVGLILVALAQVIVRFTVNRISCVNGKTSAGQTCKQ